MHARSLGECPTPTARTTLPSRRASASTWPHSATDAGSKTARGAQAKVRDQLAKRASGARGGRGAIGEGHLCGMDLNDLCFLRDAYALGVVRPIGLVRVVGTGPISSHIFMPNSIQKIKHHPAPLLPLVEQHPPHLRTVHLQPELKLCNASAHVHTRRTTHLCRTPPATRSRSAGTWVTCSDPPSICRARSFRPVA